MNASVCSPLCCQVTPGGSAARAGLQMGDAVLEVNGYPVGGDNDPNRLQQLSEAEPPLCLKLAARSQQDLEAWISLESGKVKSKTDGNYEKGQIGGLLGRAERGVQEEAVGHRRWGQKDAEASPIPEQSEHVGAGK